MHGGLHQAAREGITEAHMAMFNAAMTDDPKFCLVSGIARDVLDRGLEVLLDFATLRQHDVNSNLRNSTKNTRSAMEVFEAEQAKQGMSVRLYRRSFEEHINYANKSVVKTARNGWGQGLVLENYPSYVVEPETDQSANISEYRVQDACNVRCYREKLWQAKGVYV